MKRAAKVLSVALVAAMAITFSACSSNKNSNSPSAPAATPVATPVATQPAAATPAATQPAGATPVATPVATTAAPANYGTPQQTGGDTTSAYKVSMYVDGSDQPTGVQAVDDAMSSYLSSQYGLSNTTVDLQFITWGTYETQLNPMVAAGTQFDIAYVSNGWGFDYTQNMPQGAFLDWQPYLSYVPEYQQMMAPYMTECINFCDAWAPKDSNGKLVPGLYMVPAFKEWAGQGCVIVNTTQAQQYNIDTSSITGLSDLTSLMQSYHSQNPSGYAFVANSNNVFSLCNLTNQNFMPSNFTYYYDSTTDAYESTWSNQSWMDTATLLQQWNAAGYIPADELTTDNATLLSGANWLFYINVTKPAANEQDAMSASTRGYDQIRIPIGNSIYSMNNVYGCPFVLSTTSGNPDRAAYVYMLCCVDPVLTNLWCFGIEGTNYSLDSNGQVVPSTTDTSYNVIAQDYELGNEFLRLTTQGEPLDLGKQLQDFNTSSVTPKNNGFNPIWNTADQAATQSKYGYDYVTFTTELSNTNTQYQAQLNAGQLTTDQINGITSKLTADGMTGYLQNINDLYKEWLADPASFYANHS